MCHSGPFSAQHLTARRRLPHEHLVRDLDMRTFCTSGDANTRWYTTACAATHTAGRTPDKRWRVWCTAAEATTHLLFRQLTVHDERPLLRQLLGALGFGATHEVVTQLLLQLVLRTTRNVLTKSAGDGLLRARAARACSPVLTLASSPSRMSWGRRSALLAAAISLPYRAWNSFLVPYCTRNMACNTTREPRPDMCSAPAHARRPCPRCHRAYFAGADDVHERPHL